jgi:type II secretory pathway pseudopilin PulG
MSRPVRRGFMLLESAAALLVIGLTASAALQVYAAEMRAAAREPRLLTATVLAQDRLAAVRLVASERLGRLPDSLARGRFDAPFADYRWQVSTARQANTDIYDVHVAITWDDGTFATWSRIYAPNVGSTR